MWYLNGILGMIAVIGLINATSIGGTAGLLVVIVCSGIVGWLAGNVK